jgi:hypothetical protein
MHHRPEDELSVWLDPTYAAGPRTRQLRDTRDRQLIARQRDGEPCPNCGCYEELLHRPGGEDRCHACL